MGHDCQDAMLSQSPSRKETFLSSTSGRILLSNSLKEECDLESESENHSVMSDS